MDQVIGNKEARDILKQMETYQFDMPLKVSLILEDSDLNVKTSHRGTLNEENKDFCSNNMRRTLLTSTSRDNNNCRDSMKTINNQSCQSLYTTLTARKSRLLRQSDVLSLDLIRVIEFKKDAINNYNYDTKMYEKAIDNYLRFKFNIFYKSYPTASSLIVPQVKNKSFIKAFINRTLDIAQIKSSYISEKMVKIILSDLILWTEVKTAGRTKDVEYNKCKDTELDQVKNRRVIVHHELSLDLEDKSTNAVLPTVKSYLNDKILYNNVGSDGEGILASKRQKIVKTYANLPNNPVDLDEIGISGNEIDSKKKNLLCLDTISRDSTISSYINRSCEVKVFTTQNELGITMNSKPNCNTTTFNTSNTLLGQCSVCEEFTMYMCLGCEKKYYCSLICQSLEWATHKDSCRI